MTTSTVEDIVHRWLHSRGASLTYEETGQLIASWQERGAEIDRLADIIHDTSDPAPLLEDSRRAALKDKL